ncbi:FHA domain-containing protein [Myxococcus sp. AM011]|uniref:FHA domain-containing protein n=1 Tax=Myxococcus sp. AM011 TaxID=2745200 RepID=UPI0020CD98B4|nr:FHA domain-containing protein [Myxococcus sp. AM011]
MPILLSITKGLQQGRELVFEQAEVNIGRTSENDLVLHDHGVSRLHARIILRGGQYFTQDMGSSNGTALNGSVLKGEQLLRDGDRIAVGPVEFTFLWVPPDGDEDATRPIRRNPQAPPPPGGLEQQYLPTGEVPLVAPVAPRLVPVLADDFPALAPPSGKRPLVAPVAPRPVPVLADDFPALAPPSGKRPLVAPVAPSLPVLEPLVEERTEVALTADRLAMLPGPPVMEPAEEERTEVALSIRVPPVATAMPPGLIEPFAEEREERTELALPTLADLGLLLEESTVDADATRPIRTRAPGTEAPVPAPLALAPASPPPALVSETTKVTSAPAPTGPTAADRARKRRELAGTRAGQLWLWWRGLPLARKLLTSTVTLFILGLAGSALAFVFLPGGVASGGQGVEPLTLGVENVPDSFGLGEGVRWEHTDQKSFDFQFVAPTRAVALLHYQASGISKEEVSLSLNGVNLGWVPPDTTATAERELEHILPARTLKRGELNSFVFDNVRNPPGNETWRVWNLRLEVIPVPELPPEQLLAQARDYASTGRRFFDTRGVGAENLFRAWQQFRFAWLTLEAMDPKPDLYQDVRYQLSQVSAELDHQCAQLMLEFHRSVQFRSARKARAALQEVSRRFPTTEHRCHNLAQEKAFEHEL